MCIRDSPISDGAELRPENTLLVVNTSVALLLCDVTASRINIYSFALPVALTLCIVNVVPVPPN